MVVDEINVMGVAAFQAENYAIVCSHRYGIESREIAFQGMKPETGRFMPSMLLARFRTARMFSTFST